MEIVVDAKKELTVDALRPDKSCDDSIMSRVNKGVSVEYTDVERRQDNKLTSQQHQRWRANGIEFAEHVGMMV